MGKFDRVNDWFDEEEKRTQNKRVHTEQDIIDLLSQMEQSEQARLKQEKEKYIGGFMPEKPEFVYREYERSKDGELLGNAIAERRPIYDREKEEAKLKYDTEVNNLMQDADNAVKEATVDKTDITSAYNDKMNEFRTAAIRNNIYDSSIVGGQKDKYQSQMNDDIDAVIDELESRLNKVKADKSAADSAIANTLERMSQDYEQDVSDSYNRQKKAEQAELDKVNAENSDTAKREREFADKMQNIRTEKAAEYDRQLKDLFEREAKYGYEGARKKEYDDRVALAMSYYGKLPKEQALKEVQNNYALAQLLGHEYINFVRRIMNG